MVSSVGISIPLLSAVAALMMLTQSAYGFTSSSTSMRMLPRQRASRAGAMRSPGICSLSAQDVSVTLQRPLGIVFEEVEPGQAEGVVVAKIEPGSNAERDGRILIGDKLLATSAVVMDDSNGALIGLGGGGPKTNWTRKMIPVGKATFQTIMGAIGSNTGRWGYTDVRLTLRRTANSVPRSTDTIKREGGRGAGEEKELPLATPRDEWAD